MDTLDTHNTALDAYADHCVRSTLAMYADRPDLLATLTNERLTAFRAEQRAIGVALLADVADPASCWRRHQHGAFHATNRASRALFTAVTGVRLPPTAAGTEIAVRAYVGTDTAAAIDAMCHAWTMYYDHCRNVQRATQERQRLRGIVQRLAAGDPVSGADLVDCARHQGLTVHPRTAGLCARTITTICGTHCTVRGRHHDTDGVWRLYHAVMTTLKEKIQDEPCKSGNDHV